MVTTITDPKELVAAAEASPVVPEDELVPSDIVPVIPLKKSDKDDRFVVLDDDDESNGVLEGGGALVRVSFRWFIERLIARGK
jgi:hypothetical protein